MTRLLFRRTVVYATRIAAAALLGAWGGLAQAQTITRRSLDREIFAALLDSLGRDLDTLIIAESTLVFSSEIRPGQSVSADTMLIGLRNQLASISRHRRSSATLPLPKPFRIASDKELRKIFRSGTDGWAKFYRRYPRQRTFFAFTPVAYSRDSTQAYIHVEHYCGSRGAGGESLWFVRSADHKWHIRLRTSDWSS